MASSVDIRREEEGEIKRVEDEEVAVSSGAEEGVHSVEVDDEEIEVLEEEMEEHDEEMDEYEEEADEYEEVIEVIEEEVEDEEDGTLKDIEESMKQLAKFEATLKENIIRK